MRRARGDREGMVGRVAQARAVARAVARAARGIRGERAGSVWLRDEDGRSPEG